MSIFVVPLSILAIAVLFNGWPKFITINHNHYYDSKPKDTTGNKGKQSQ